MPPMSPLLDVAATYENTPIMLQLAALRGHAHYLRALIFLLLRRHAAALRLLPITRTLLPLRY